MTMVGMPWGPLPVLVVTAGLFFEGAPLGLTGGFAWVVAVAVISRCFERA